MRVLFSVINGKSSEPYCPNHGTPRRAAFDTWFQF